MYHLLQKVAKSVDMYCNENHPVNICLKESYHPPPTTPSQQGDFGNPEITTGDFMSFGSGSQNYARFAIECPPQTSQEKQLDCPHVQPKRNV